MNKKMEWVLRRAGRALRGGDRDELDAFEVRLFWHSNGMRLFFALIILTAVLPVFANLGVLPIIVTSNTVFMTIGVWIGIAFFYLSLTYWAYRVSISSVKDLRRIRRQSESHERISSLHQVKRDTEVRLEAAKKEFLERAKVSQRTESWPFISHVWWQLECIADFAAVSLKEEVGAPCRFTLHALRHHDDSGRRSSPIVVTALQDAYSRLRANRAEFAMDYREHPLFREILDTPFDVHKGFLVRKPFEARADSPAGAIAKVIASGGESMAVHAILNPVQNGTAPLIIGFVGVESLKDLSGANNVREILDNFAHQVYYTLKLITEVTVASSDQVAIADEPAAANLLIGWQRLDGTTMRAADDKIQHVLDRQLDRLISDDGAPVGRGRDNNSGAMIGRPAYHHRDDHALPPIGGQALAIPDSELDAEDDALVSDIACAAHPDADDLTWYVLLRHQLGNEEIASIADHLESCDRCKAIVAHLKENEVRFKADLEEELQRT